MVKLTKAFIAKLVKNPLATLATLTEDEIATIIQKANYEYRQTNNALFSDNIYDLITDYLEEKNPNHPVLKVIGCNVGCDVRKTKLPYYMGSLDKIKTDEKAFEKWKAKYTCSYVISEKLDGNSGLYYVNDDKNVSIYTRGDGTHGQNVTSLLPFVRGLPAVIPKPQTAIRGEFIISKSDFLKLKDKGANARNMVAGILNAKLPDVEIAKHVQFIAYEVINPVLPPEQQMEFMEEAGFKTVWNKVITEKTLSLDKLSDVLVDRRAKSEFDIDGIVVMHNDSYEREKENPKYAFAFKNIQTMDRAEVIVSKVEWNISKDGYMRPVVIFNPVYLAGVTIQRATGFNGKYIKDNKIGPGSRIIVMRSGDVIPYITEILSPSESGEGQMPNIQYTWTATGVDIVAKTTEVDDQLRKKNLQYFFDKIDIKGVSAATIGKLYDAGYETVKAIFDMQKSDILKLDGFKDKSAEKLYSSLQERRKDLTCIQIMEASNTLGRGFGAKKLELITAEFPTIISKKYVPSLTELTGIKGVEKKTAEAFRENLPVFFKFVEENSLKCLGGPSSPNQKQHVTSDHSLSGIKVLFSGFRDKDLEAYIKEHGGEIASSMSKKVTSLVVKDTQGKETGKVKEAHELNIPVVSVEEFKKQIKFSV